MEEEQKWLLETAKGNRQAFEKLMGKYEQPVFRFLYRFLGSSQDAEDVAQEVFVKLFRRASSYKPTHPLSHYLFRIASNAAKKKLRRKKIIHFLSLEWLTSSKEEEGRWELPETNPLQTTEYQLQQKETQKTVHAALLSLPERQRTALILSVYEDKSSKEISQILSLKSNAVDALLFRARRTLKKKLEGVRF